MPNGLEAVFLNNRAALLRFLRARGADDAAEDLIQELWFRVSRSSAEPIAEPLAYLYRAADNLVTDRFRKSSSRTYYEQEWVKVAFGTSRESAQIASGEDVVLARDELRRIEAALAELGDRAELVFRRYRIDGLTQRQVAEELGISVSGVEKHLQRAYRALLRLRRETDADAG